MDVDGHATLKSSVLYIRGNNNSPLRHHNIARATTSEARARITNQPTSPSPDPTKTTKAGGAKKKPAVKNTTRCVKGWG